MISDHWAYYEERVGPNSITVPRRPNLWSVCVRTSTHFHIHTSILDHSYTHTHIHTAYVHTYIHIYIHTYPSAQKDWFPSIELVRFQTIEDGENHDTNRCAWPCGLTQIEQMLSGSIPGLPVTRNQVLVEKQLAALSGATIYLPKRTNNYDLAPLMRLTTTDAV
ncbi:hypothetical protein F4779DRAFT_314635 [Xylariaceae sp. FL0662B]|nr:hypothetical protein F4779DRAFT_314635 [Xylariaceae sp. FL0662B]